MLIITHIRDLAWWDGSRLQTMGLKWRSKGTLVPTLMVKDQVVWAQLGLAVVEGKKVAEVLQILQPLS